MNKQGQSNKCIDALAKQLVVNHLYLALRDENNHRLPESIDNYLSEVIARAKNFHKRHEERTIVAIVGSGASSMTGLPTSQSAVERIKSKLNIPPILLKKQLDRLESVFRLNRNEFETQLRAISILTPEDLRQELQKLFNIRFVPLLHYELLAHMLKHRFLDIIINFNFDELLDQSIEDEMGPNEYHKIITDGDCPDYLLDKSLFKIKNYRPDLPIYIKPHGTAKYKSTLRFTRDDYYGLSPDIRMLLYNLLKESHRPLTLIVIGFGMRSFEFNDIIDEPNPSSEIFYFARGKPKPDRDLNKYTWHLIKLTESKPLDSYIYELWNQIADHFCPAYKPKSINRHLLVSRLFGNREISMDKREDTNYLHDRTTIELILFIAKSKGFINFRELDDDRCGTYYDLYWRYSSNEGKKPRTLLSLCNDLNFIGAEYGHEILVWNDSRSRNSSNDTANLLLTKKSFNDWLELRRNRSAILDNFTTYGCKVPCSEKDKSDFHDYAREWINSIFKDENNTEIVLNYNTLHHKLYSEPMAISTHTALKWHTRWILKQNWDTLLIIAETGSWLGEEDFINIMRKKSGKLNLFIIVADMSRKDKIIDALTRIALYNRKLKLGYCLKHLNWWEHNRHMTIIMEKKKPLYSIYFTRRLRSSSICPVMLGEKDSGSLLNIFFAYWEKCLANETRRLNYEKIKNHDLNMTNLFKDLKMLTRGSS